MNYKIPFKLLKNDKLVKKQTIIVKNKVDEYFAKGALEVYLRKKYIFDNIIYGDIIITYVEDEKVLNDLKSIFNMT